MQEHNNIRYEALSRDWNRQRDKLASYRLAIRWALWGVATWVVLLLLFGCAAPFLPSVPPVDQRGTPDLYLADGSPCWYLEQVRHPLTCDRRPR